MMSDQSVFGTCGGAASSVSAMRGIALLSPFRHTIGNG